MTVGRDYKGRFISLQTGRDASAAGITLVGLDKLASRLESFARRFPDEIGRALYAEAEVEMTEAKRRTPVKTGTLRGSGHVEPPRYRGREISVTMAFGGPARGYAIQVHENLGAYHPVGQAKFLESTVRESAPYLAARVSRRVRLNRMV